MTDDPRPPSRPFVIHEGDEADPGLAPDVPEALPEGAAMQAAAAVVTAKAGGLWSWAGAAFGLLFSFVLSVAAWDFVTSLLARNAFLGWLAGVLIVVAVGFALLLGLREYAAYARLHRLDSFRDHAREARAKADIALARRVTGNLTRLYATRPDTAWGRARLAEREAEVMDADALLALAEHELLAPLDARAKAEVEEAARRVALVTALVPLALADVAAALFSNLRMIRRLAEIYGGRSGTFGSLGLLRRVFTSLIATGAVALTDDLMGSVAGGGVLSKLSRRFGEGVVNGALTARVGVAAIELCRPLPFVAVERPGVSGLVSRALTGLVPRG
ncbi:YcjF family protein [Neotabrizicola sp. sgz301269]|uniref:YcjF family protein n=1 Tax=Neotabrizicola sp. sgz301269 TaxID=3276282 RepID=UPI00376FEC15